MRFSFLHRLFALLLWVARAVASLRRDQFSSKFHGLRAVAVVDMRTGCASDSHHAYSGDGVGFFQRSHLQVFGDVSTSSPVYFEIRWAFVRDGVVIKKFNDSGGSLALL